MWTWVEDVSSKSYTHEALYHLVRRVPVGQSSSHSDLTIVSCRAHNRLTCFSFELILCLCNWCLDINQEKSFCPCWVHLHPCVLDWSTTGHCCPDTSTPAGHYCYLHSSTNPGDIPSNCMQGAKMGLFSWGSNPEHLSKYLQESVAIKLLSLRHGPEPDVSKFFSSYNLVSARGLTMWFH